MTKRLLIFSFIAQFLLASPVAIQAAEVSMSAIEESIVEEVSIAVNGQIVTVTGAQGQVLEVVSLTGRRVTSVKIESPAQRVELNIPKGCYILKVGKVVRKVSVH